MGMRGKKQKPPPARTPESLVPKTRRLRVTFVVWEGQLPSALHKGKEVTVRYRLAWLRHQGKLVEFYLDGFGYSAGLIKVRQVPSLSAHRPVKPTLHDFKDFSERMAEWAGKHGNRQFVYLNPDFEWEEACTREIGEDEFALYYPDVLARWRAEEEIVQRELVAALAHI